MSIYLWIGAVVVLLPLAGRWLIRWGSQPMVVRGVPINDLARFFSTLLTNGLPGALLFLVPEVLDRDEGFLQFVNTDGAGASASIEFGFPMAPWSAAHYLTVQSALDEAGFDISVRDVKKDAGAVEEFLLVNVGADVSEAVRLVTVVLAALGDRSERLTKAWLAGCRASL